MFSDLWSEEETPIYSKEKRKTNKHPSTKR